MDRPIGLLLAAAAAIRQR